VTVGAQRKHGGPGALSALRQCSTSTRSAVVVIQAVRNEALGDFKHIRALMKAAWCSRSASARADNFDRHRLALRALAARTHASPGLCFLHTRVLRRAQLAGQSLASRQGMQTRQLAPQGWKARAARVTSVRLPVPVWMLKMHMLSILSVGVGCIIHLGSVCVRCVRS
jgi:hypothetical protein